MPIYAEKNVRCVHFAEICEKCGSMRNMWQWHIHIKLTCLTKDAGAAFMQLLIICKFEVSTKTVETSDSFFLKSGMSCAEI